LVGTKATGGGSLGSKGTEGSVKKYADMTTGERTAHFQANPEQAEIDHKNYIESK
jgi:hypothetical protein